MTSGDNGKNHTKSKIINGNSYTCVWNIIVYTTLFALHSARGPIESIRLSDMRAFRRALALLFAMRLSLSFIQTKVLKPFTSTLEMNGVADGSAFADFYSSITKRLTKCEELRPIPLDNEFCCAVGKLGKSRINFRAEAFNSNNIRYARMVSFVGEGYDVLNFVAIPRSNVEIPILGIDIVCLPGLSFKLLYNMFGLSNCISAIL
jgi:hypothetical protein